jgi:hypothetical protein
VNRKTQCAAILRLLTDARGAWVPLWRILDLRIGQYNARLSDLRHKFGYKIENKKEPSADGKVHSWYRLIRDPVPPTQDEGTSPQCNVLEDRD